MLSNGSEYPGAVLSPDGVHVVFSGTDAATGKIALYLRRLAAVDAAMIPGTEGALYPFWSPNNRSVAYFAQGKLKRIDINGSGAQDICDSATGGWGSAASWSAPRSRSCTGS